MRADFYVYEYLREDGTPYYIGKGSGKRAFSKHVIKIPDDHSRIRIVAENLLEADAFALEISLIAKHGRKDKGTGILRNLSDGGEGPSGWICTDKTRAKMSLVFTGRVFSEEHKAKLASFRVGKKLSEETRARMSASKIGRVVTDEQRKAMSAHRKGKPLSEQTLAKRAESRRISKWVLVHSAETKAKISAGGKGRIVSEETRARMSAAACARHIRNVELSKVDKECEYVQEIYQETGQG